MKKKPEQESFIDKIHIELYELIKDRKENMVESGGLMLVIVPLNSQEQLEVEQGIIKQLLYHPIPTLGVFMYAPLEININECV